LEIDWIKFILFQGEVIISDFYPECVNAMLEFFYNGKIKKGIFIRKFYYFHK